MRKTFWRTFLGVMAKRYDYDVTYMQDLLETSPRGFEKFSKLFELARHCESAPAEAVIAAKLVGALAEDCGPCTQLVVNFAKEQKVAPDQVEAVLTRNTGAMSNTTALAYLFAEAVVHRLPHEDEAREAVRGQWGDKGVIDLTFGCQIGRVFPMVKAGLGYAKECRRVDVAGKMVSVVKREMSQAA